MPKNNKSNIILDSLILVILFFIYLFTLPTFGHWSVYDRSPKLVYSQSIQDLYSYQHPPKPQVTPDSSPVLQAPYFVVIDNDTNTVLASKNQNIKVFPASITKLATTLTALNIYPLDEIITIREEYTEGKVMELKPNEKITVRNLVSAILIHSANDAAYSLAIHHPNGLHGFVDQMNLLVKKYNLTNTHFSNYDGLHNDNHYSTVYELAQLGRIAIKNPIISDVVKTKEMIVSDINLEQHHQLVSTNELLGIVPEVEGLKTGWTPEAGGCFVSLININGHRLISVVVQSQDRFGDTRKLIDWIKENVTWTTY